MGVTEEAVCPGPAREAQPSKRLGEMGSTRATGIAVVSAGHNVPSAGRATHGTGSAAAGDDGRRVTVQTLSVPELKPRATGPPTAFLNKTGGGGGRGGRILCRENVKT